MKFSHLLLLVIIVTANSSIYKKYYQQAYTIAASMTLDQKIGQTIQLDFYGITGKNGTTSADAIKFSLGSLLVGGNGCPDINGDLIYFDGLKEDQIKAIYANCTLDKWQKLGEKMKYTININANNGKTYKISPLLATDAVHGDQHVMGNILFPHNIGLSCSHNPTHFYNQGYWTTQSLKKYGFNYAFAPTVAVSHNPQWGRYYQTMGQQHDYIYQYGKAFTEGLQGKPSTLTGILGSVKHFFADGATMYGADQGNAQVGSFKNFVYHNTQGYNGSISAEIGSVMSSYSAINFVPLSTGSYLNSILRKQLNFDGFVISDYNQVNKIAEQALPTTLAIMKKNQSVATMFSAGIDMFMIPGRGQMFQYISFTKMGLQNNTITMQRLNDAVARILSVKLALGMIQVSNTVSLIKQQKSQSQHLPPKSTNQYQDSLDAVHESLVLLKNQNNILPIQKSQIQYVVLVGQRIININNLAKNQLFLNYDNIGMQSGGWSARWQGFQGNVMWEGQNKKKSNASSIVDALKTVNEKIKLVYPNYTTFTQQLKINTQRNAFLNQLKTLRKNMTPKNTLILAVMGQSPYAQVCGDINIPYCQNSTLFGGQGCQYFPNTYGAPKQKNSLQIKFDTFQKNVIDHIKQQDKNIPLLTVLLSGRPMIINQMFNQSTAFISAFLPGTSGGHGVVDAIVGDYILRPKGQTDRVNSLSFNWPKSMKQLQEFPYYSADGTIPQIEDPLFKVGYGLSTK